MTRASELFSGGGSYFGIKPPKYITGAGYSPLGYGGTTSSLTTTATRCYYIPFPIVWAHTFTGAQMTNSGSSDSGEKCRLMMFADDGAAGGPGTLSKDFGEITFGGGAAINNLSSSWAATPGMYWGAAWFDSASAVGVMAPYIAASGVGGALGRNTINLIGQMAAATTFSTDIGMVGAHYVDTTYGAAPSTAVAPTASTISNFTATGVSPNFRLIG